MLTGKPYSVVRTEIKFDGNAVSAYDEQEYLNANGYRFQTAIRWAGGEKFRWYGDGECPFTGWPPPPWADLHLCSIMVNPTSIFGHRVIILKDGTVLDPLTPDPKRLTDYAGVYRAESLERDPKQD